MTTRYEWDYETITDGDITDHNHSDRLSDFQDIHKTESLVLVRDTGSEANGLEERYWAYVNDGKLPEYFSDSRGEVNIRVPKKFHIELAKYLNTRPVS